MINVSRNVLEMLMRRTTWGPVTLTVASLLGADVRRLVHFSQPKIEAMVLSLKSL